jgi:hypothetical protein
VIKKPARPTGWAAVGLVVVHLLALGKVLLLGHLASGGVGSSAGGHALLAAALGGGLMWLLWWRRKRDDRARQ